MWLLALIGVLGVLSIAYHYARTGVPPVSSPAREIADVLALLAEARLPEGATIYELGCGSGALAAAIARAFPKARVVGVEVSPIPSWLARLRTRGLANVTIVREDYARTDLSGAGAVTAYLMIGAAARLAPLLDAKLRRGTPVVASMFWFRGRTPRATRRQAALYDWPS